MVPPRAREQKQLRPQPEPMASGPAGVTSSVVLVATLCVCINLVLSLLLYQQHTEHGRWHSLSSQLQSTSRALEIPATTQLLTPGAGQLQQLQLLCDSIESESYSGANKGLTPPAAKTLQSLQHSLQRLQSTPTQQAGHNTVSKKESQVLIELVSQLQQALEAHRQSILQTYNQLQQALLLFFVLSLFTLSFLLFKGRSSTPDDCEGSSEEPAESAAIPPSEQSNSVDKPLPVQRKSKAPLVLGPKQSANGQRRELNLRRKDGAALTVLLVDDNRINRQVAGQLLRHHNLQVVEAENGKQCLELARKIQPELILLDLMMPEMDGLTVIEQLKHEHSPLKVIPIIALTALDIDATRAQCFAAGCADYVVKPMTSRRLLEAIQNALASTTQEEGRQTSDGGVIPEHLSPILDKGIYNRLARLAGAQSSFMVEIVQSYTEQLPQRISDLQAAFDEKDTVKLERLAHSLKGSSSSLGLLEISQVCNIIEEAATTANLDKAPQQLELLKQAIERGKTALSEQLHDPA